jgi:hypothetical protein
MSEKTEKSRLSEYSLIRKSGSIDNPILRHFIKKHKLDDQDSLLLSVILDLTDQMKTPIKTTYRSLADSTDLTAGGSCCSPGIRIKGHFQERHNGRRRIQV